MFVDEVQINVEGGHGGPGIVAWRREKFVPLGGPAGGDGGDGGSVVVRVDRNLRTLMDLRYQRHIRAEKGISGGPSRKHGRNGLDRIIPVPPGTQIYDTETGELLADLTVPGSELIVAHGGKGGRGNARFTTATNRAPTRREVGLDGEVRQLRLELKLLADVGIVGYPSVGKSTLISVISGARPKIASYPFTTLVPNLGLVKWRDTSFVVADIPGLIEGASEGQGLGHQFLRHVERCGILLHMVEVPPPFEYATGDIDWTERSPVRDFELLNRELALFNADLGEREQVVVLNKVDLPYVAAERDDLEEAFRARGHRVVSISAATRVGLGPLVDLLGAAVLERAKVERERAAQEMPALLRLPTDHEADAHVRRGAGASGAGRSHDPDTAPAD